MLRTSNSITHQLSMKCCFTIEHVKKRIIIYSHKAFTISALCQCSITGKLQEKDIGEKYMDV